MVLIVDKKGREESLDFRSESTLMDLKKAYKPQVSVHRKAFKLEQGEGKAVALNGDDKTLAELGVTATSRLSYKDLGPQIGYRTVFVVEYAGPIAIMALYATQPQWIYGAASQGGISNSVQKLYTGLFLAHFVKREFETFFVHKFSRPTMPLFNIFKNSIYYWSFAAFIGYFLCHPKYTAPTHGLEKVFAGLWGLFELGNLGVHLQLSGMRKQEGETTRNVPKGPLFSLVSCPNYTFEVLGWAAFSAGCSVAWSWVFTFLGLAQMTEWALKKHKGYVKADPANKKKKSILPFII